MVTVTRRCAEKEKEKEGESERGWSERMAVKAIERRWITLNTLFFDTKQYAADALIEITRIYCFASMEWKTNEIGYRDWLRGR